MPKIQFSLQDGTELVHEITEDLVTIGRMPDSTIEISDVSVSSNHAEIRLAEEGVYVLTDLGSTNGTRVNGEHLTPNEGVRLKEGDAVRVGNVRGYFGERPATSEAQDSQKEAEEADDRDDVDSDSEEVEEAEEAEESEVAAGAAPGDFQNASPFPHRSQKKDPASLAILGLGALAILAFLVAAALIFSMKSPV